MSNDLKDSNGPYQGLETAPEHVKLAVDLIMLLENNEIPTQTALDALEIVKLDLLNKQSAP